MISKSISSGTASRFQGLASMYLCVALVATWSTQARAQAFFESKGAYQPAAQQSAVMTFYLHDNLDTSPASAMTVVQSLSNVNGASNTELFGAMAVFDDSITVSSDPSSQEMGRGRGFYVFNSMDPGSSSLEFVWTAVFNSASGYGGSTITFKGYDLISNAYREIAITGGTGQFRMARGWAGITTSSADGGAAILTFTVNVFYGA